MKLTLFSLMTLLPMMLVSQVLMAGPNEAGSSQQPVSQEQKQIPGWVTRGADCYGIVFFTFQDGTTKGQAIKTKVLLVDGAKVRLRAMESINLSEREGCGALGVNYGDTWWETEPGDLFRTREAANAFLKEKGWLK